MKNKWPSLSPPCLIYLCQKLGLLHHQCNVASSHWLLSQMFSSYRSTCPILGGSFQKYLTNPVACTRSFIRAENRGKATTVAKISLGRCILHSQIHAGHTRTTPVDISPLARWLCQLVASCPAEGSNARGLGPLGRWGLLTPIFRFGSL